MQPTQPLQRALRRLKLTTKQVGKGYYKGTGGGSMGRHTKHGAYIIDYEKVRTYVSPSKEELKDFKLTPFVTKKIKEIKGEYRDYRKGPLSGARYIENWKRENGEN